MATAGGEKGMATKTEQFLAGESTDCYRFLGSRSAIKSVDGRRVRGVSFAVWAPNAAAVRVVGDFNGWGMQDSSFGSTLTKNEYGVWSGFVKGLRAGALYKYEITGRDGETVLKADPMCYMSELRPGTASVVYDLKPYPWSDGTWMETRAKTDYYRAPVNIYEVHLGSWKRGVIPGLSLEESEERKSDEPFLNYREIADKLSEYVKTMGYTHVELMPVSEHPLDASWGYQTLCFYSVTSRHGTPDDLRYFVDKMHENGIGVIFDWVPGHFCKDLPGLYRFDGTWLYENEHALLRENEQWGTANFDLGKGAVQSFLISNAMYYFNEYHADGLRSDAVTNIICRDYGKTRTDALKNRLGGYENLEGIAFCRKLNQTVSAKVKGALMIAEESTAWPHVTGNDGENALGFTFKWNMGWMNDTLEYIKMDPIYRQYHHEKMTFSMMYAYAENYILPLSHDEVVHGKRSLLDKCFGEYEQKFACLRSYYTYMIGHPGKKLLFMGGEFGPFLEWRYYEALEWKMLLYPKHSMLREYVKALNLLYREEPSLWEKDPSPEGFEWIDADDRSRNLLSFVRKGNDGDDMLLFVCNFSPVAHHSLSVGIPRFTDYTEVLNSDGEAFGGSGMVNEGLIRPRPQGAGKKRFSIQIRLAPYGAAVFRPVIKQTK